MPHPELHGFKDADLVHEESVSGDEHPEVLLRQVEHGGAGQHTAGVHVHEASTELLQLESVGRLRVEQEWQSSGEGDNGTELGLKGISEDGEAVAICKAEQLQRGLQVRKRRP